MEVKIVESVMRVNDELAHQVRERLDTLGLMAVNFISGPGAGKTTLIEKTLSLGDKVPKIAVIEGDPDTSLDAERIAKYNVPVVQINTRGGCHLEANLILKALDSLESEHGTLAAMQLIFIENVGNLVCPVSFDVGEKHRVALVSTTEGHDKPAKYPKLFRTADIVLLNKIDLLPYVDFDCTQFEKYVHDINPNVPVLHLSCKTGEGLESWLKWVWALVENQETPVICSQEAR